MSTAEQHGGYERFILHAVESYLRGTAWKSALAAFYSTNCPRFQHFSDLNNVQSNSYNDLDVHTHLVYIEFKDIVEQELHKLFVSLGSTQERFMQLLEMELCRGDETVERLYDTLTCYRDFVSFGRLMQRMFAELYPTEAKIVQGESVRRIRICRVLWDLENVVVDPNIGGIETVAALQEFLRSRGLWGAGIDTRITAFFNPFNKCLPKKVIEQLNKAAVELVCASAKREDADRKLGIRINQEMQILLPELTTFVVISSDQDFRQHLQLLSNAGYTTMLIHEARNENWRRTLEMQAGTGVQWSEVLSYLPTSATPAAEDSELRSGIFNEVRPAVSKSTVAAGEISTPQRDTSLETAAVGWRVAVCQRWASAYGFLLVDVAHPEVTSDFTLASAARLRDADVRIDSQRNRKHRNAQNQMAPEAGTAVPPVDGNTDPSTTGSSSGTIVRVYVHHSALSYKPAGQRMLRAGEYVLAQVVQDAKGPKAAVVKNLLPVANGCCDAAGSEVSSS
jgi:hypothetical protein